ncbi:helix-turn-helix domain-containing protein [Rummeliibacillus stabekisii]|uniref:helix-turn-helix domain-containing protein n=1 Tax=Rummeliibacillus stabekisii TaxID=241244 RepID=UPI0037212024
MARFEYLAPYTSFTTIQEMDEQVEQHIRKHYYNLTTSDKSVLYKMASHALDYPGACHLKAQTIADALGISVRTVFRTLKRLEEFQIIKRIQTKKMNGIKGANIFSILSCDDTLAVAHQEEAETPCESKVEAAQLEQEPSLSSNPKHQYGKHTYPMLNTSLRNRIFHYLLSTTGNTSETKKFVDVVYKQLKPLLEWEIYQVRKQQLEDISFTAFKETIQQTKRQFITNPFGYMYKKLDRKLDRFTVGVMEFYEEESRNGSEIRLEFL